MSCWSRRCLCNNNINSSGDGDGGRSGNNSSVKRRIYIRCHARRIMDSGDVFACGTAAIVRLASRCRLALIFVGWFCLFSLIAMLVMALDLSFGHVFLLENYIKQEFADSVMQP